MRQVIATMVVLIVVLTFVIVVTFSKRAQHKAIPVARSVLTGIRDESNQGLEVLNKLDGGPPSALEMFRARVEKALARREAAESAVGQVEADIKEAKGRLAQIFREAPATPSDHPDVVAIGRQLAELIAEQADARDALDEAVHAYDAAVVELRSFEAGQPADASTLSGALRRERDVEQITPVAREASHAAAMERALATAAGEVQAAKQAASDATTAKRQAEQAAIDANANLVVEKGRREVAEATAAEATRRLEDAKPTTALQAAKSRHWVAPVTEAVVKRDWVPPTSKIEKLQVYEEPLYKTVQERIWHEATVVDDIVDVPGGWEYFDVLVRGSQGCYYRRAARYIYPHREKKQRRVDGYWEDVCRDKLVRAGGYRNVEKLVDVPGRYQEHLVEVEISPGHWEEGG